MNDADGLVLEYSSIQPEQKSTWDSAPAMASLALTAVFFIGWALHATILIFVAFVILSWFGLILGIAGMITARNQPIALAAGVIGTLVHGAMAAFVILFITHGGFC